MLHPAHPGAHRKLVLAYRTENANRIKRKEKRKMDVIGILINPSEKAKCGHGAMLTTVPPGAAAGGRLGQARRRARAPGRAQGLRHHRGATGEIGLQVQHGGVVLFFLVRHRFLREFDGVHLRNLKAAAVRAANGKQCHKHDDALCVMFSKMHRTLLGMPFRSKRRMNNEESLDKARGANALMVSSPLGL